MKLSARMTYSWSGNNCNNSSNVDTFSHFAIFSFGMYSLHKNQRWSQMNVCFGQTFPHTAILHRCSAQIDLFRLLFPWKTCASPTKRHTMAAGHGAHNCPVLLPSAFRSWQRTNAYSCFWGNFCIFFRPRFCKHTFLYRDFVNIPVCFVRNY